jgi:hypothetical protein
MIVYPLKKMKICRWGPRRPQVGVGGLNIMVKFSKSTRFGVWENFSQKARDTFVRLCCSPYLENSPYRDKFPQIGEFPYLSIHQEQWVYNVHMYQ